MRRTLIVLVFLVFSAAFAFAIVSVEWHWYNIGFKDGWKWGFSQAAGEKK